MINMASMFALCAVSFAAGATFMLAAVLGLGLIGEMMDRFDGKDGR